MSCTWCTNKLRALRGCAGNYWRRLQLGWRRITGTSSDDWRILVAMYWSKRLRYFWRRVRRSFGCSVRKAKRTTPRRTGYSDASVTQTEFSDLGHNGPVSPDARATQTQSSDLVRSEPGSSMEDSPLSPPNDGSNVEITSQSSSNKVSLLLEHNVVQSEQMPTDEQSVQMQLKAPLLPREENQRHQEQFSVPSNQVADSSERKYGTF